MGKVLHASKSGYFPFCISEVGSITEGFRGTLEQMMTIYWRVKKWNIAMSGSGLLSGLYDVSFNQIAYELARLTPQQTEESIVCSSNFFFFAGSFPISLPDVVLRGFFELEFSGARKSGYTYSLGGRAVVDGDGYNGIRTNSDGGSVVGTWSMEFFGGPIVGNLYSQSGGSQTLGDWDSSSNIIMTISASEYWSYGGTYDTSTGEPL